MNFATYRDHNLVAIQLPDNKFEIKQVENGYLGYSVAMITLSSDEIDAIEYKSPTEYCRAALNKYLLNQ